MTGDLIALGIGSPAGVPPFLLFGLTPGPAVDLIDPLPTVVTVSFEDRLILVAADDRACIVPSEDRTIVVASALSSLSV